MRIGYLQPLKLVVPTMLAPSNYGWFSRCLLRVLYTNRENKDYEANDTPAIMGTLIHLVREDYDGGKITSYEDFERSWDRAEEKLFLLDAFRESCVNYGLKRQRLWQEFDLKLTGSIHIEKSRHNVETFRNYPIVDIENHISGKIDALVIKDGFPLEIREYKTGKAYSLDGSICAVDSDIDLICEAHRVQIMLYGWLVYHKYGRLPIWMNIIGSAGRKWQIDFSSTEISLIKEDFVKRYVFVRDNVDRPKILASPSLVNCTKCIYRFGCRESIPEIFGDFSGIVQSTRIMPFGNFEVVLNDGRRLINPRNDHGLFEADLLGLVGKAITFTNTVAGKPRLRVGGGIEDVWAPKLYSIIKVLEPENDNV